MKLKLRAFSEAATQNIIVETARRSAINICTYGCPVNKDGYGICSKTMMMLYPLMEAVRSGGDLENLGGDGKYSKTIVCPDGCVMFRLTARPLGNENFHKGGFWKEP